MRGLIKLVPNNAFAGPDLAHPLGITGEKGPLIESVSKNMVPGRTLIVCPFF